MVRIWGWGLWGYRLTAEEARQKQRRRVGALYCCLWIAAWMKIESILKAPIADGASLMQAILNIRVAVGEESNPPQIRGLGQFCQKKLDPAKATEFSDEILPFMISLFLDMPALFPERSMLPFLVQGVDAELFLSQRQVACLLACGFFCAFPPQKPLLQQDLPEPNFYGLYSGLLELPPTNSAKIHCIINYFRRVRVDGFSSQRYLSYHRRVLTPEVAPQWESSSIPSRQITARREGKIESGQRTLQVDFANKCIGGGVFGSAALQEEIRFVISPELLAAMVFTAVLQDNEVLIVRGCQQFSRYAGYGLSFRFEGDFRDPMGEEVDHRGRARVEVVGMDTLAFSGGKAQQYTRASLKRELNKAYAGFATLPAEQTYGKTGEEETTEAAYPLSPVSTGNWGCGAFGGDASLKAVVQWMAASQAGRDVCYYVFDKKPLADKLEEVNHRLAGTLTVGQVWDVLSRYSDPTVDVIEALLRCHSLNNQIEAG